MIRRFGVFCLVASTTVGGCTDLLGIPEDPYLEEQEPQPPVRMPRLPSATPDVGATTDVDQDTVAQEGAATDDQAPGEAVASDSNADRPGATALAGDDEPAAPGDDAPDDDAAEGEGDDGPAATAPEPPAQQPDDEEPAPPAPPVCVPARRPVDIVLIADNSASMAAELDALERGLNDFAAQLDDEAVDYRLVLLSRQRTDARTASVQASTSLCVTAPLGALAECPAPAPAASERFLHYDVAIAESDSFDRLLDTFDFPDSHGLAPSGWGARLRIGAAKVVIEVSDGDSARPLQDFLGELSLLAPEHFGSDPAAPSFVFHSVIGVRQRAFGAVTYGPDEPLESIACGVPPTGADNAGQSYQTLSRVTGGLRFSICATGALPFVLTTLANDVIERSIVPCTTPPDTAALGAAAPDLAAAAP